MSLLFTGRNSSSASRRVSLFQRLLMGIINHMRQALASLGELWRSPLATIMTIGVLGLSITLPSTLYLMVKNTEKVTAGWEDAGEISLYLQANTTAKQAQKLLSGVSAMKNKIDDARLISPDLALEEFETLSGLGDALAYLDANPLP
ncbi:MAG: cell division protein FtsX, partial [Glaciecola sp.]